MNQVDNILVMKSLLVKEENHFLPWLSISVNINFLFKRLIRAIVCLINDWHHYFENRLKVFVSAPSAFFQYSNVFAKLFFTVHLQAVSTTEPGVQQRNEQLFSLA